MKQSPDSAFWGPLIRSVFVTEIETMKTAVLDYLLAPLPKPAARAGIESDRHETTLLTDGTIALSADLEPTGSRPGAFLGGPSAASKAMTRLAAAALWRLLQEQMSLIHLRRPFDVTEEAETRDQRAALRGPFTAEKFHRELEAEEISMRALPSWPKVEELSRVVSRGPGKALENLAKSAVEWMAKEGNPFAIPLPVLNDSPAEDDFHLTHAQLADYFDAAISLWKEFSAAIEFHFGDSKA